MGSKKRSVREGQVALAEEKLQARLAILRERGSTEQAIGRDAVAKALKAKLREARARLQAVAAHEEKAAKLAQTKAERAAAPKEAKAAKKAEEPPPETKPKKEKKKKEKPPEA